MSGTNFTPAVDVIKPGGGMLRVSSGIAGGAPAIMMETFAKVGETTNPKERMTISTAMLEHVLQAMIAAGTRAIDHKGRSKATGWAVISTDIIEAIRGNGRRERVDG